MKKLTILSVFLMSFVIASAQCVRYSGRVNMINTQIGTTDKTELFMSLEYSNFKASSTWFVSVVGEVYDAKRTEYQSTTAHLGLRVNKKFLENTEKVRILAFAGPKYMIQGSKYGAVNQFIYEGGGAFLYNIGRNDKFDGWLRANVTYNSVPGSQITYTIGIQTHF